MKLSELILLLQHLKNSFTEKDQGVTVTCSSEVFEIEGIVYDAGSMDIQIITGV